MILLYIQSKSFNITVSQDYAPTTDAKGAEVDQFLWRTTTPSRANNNKNVLFITGDWNAKVGCQKDTGNNRQVWPWNTKWNRAKANRVLTRKHAGHSEHPFPTTQEMTLHMDITRWSQPKSDYVLCCQWWRISIRTVNTRPGAMTQIMGSLLQNSGLNWRK